jgi:adenylate kinase
MNVSAMLLIGPTGVGKTPFGDYLQKSGLNGRRCIHFDFGHQLRIIAGHIGLPEGFSREEHAFIQYVLAKGLLLENEHFTLAEKIIDIFLKKNSFTGADILVLNGLPRHEDQAKDLDRIMDINSLVVLDCAAEDVFKRIRLNTGGDRTGRADDGIGMVRKKLGIFHARTAPLVSHYERAGKDVFRLKVTHSSTAEDLYADFLPMACKYLE